MDYLHTIIMGFMQGLTEFLPVSSSGHIVLTSAVYKILTGQSVEIAHDDEVFCDIMLHLGTLISICIYFRKEIWSIIKSFCNAVATKNFADYNAMLPVYIFIGTFFTCLIVYPIKDFCENMITNPGLVGIMLMITGVILLISEFIGRKFEQKADKVDMKKSVFIGIAQGLAAIPGISRSGSTIATGLAFGLSREKSARYSFLLSIPVILLAVLYNVPELIKPQAFVAVSWLPILAGTAVATIAGYLCIKYFIMFLKRFSLNVFAYYCMVIGFCALLYFGL